MMNLFRTSAPDSDRYAVADNDWDFIFLKLLAFGKNAEIDEHLLSAWNNRLRYDYKNSDPDARWAAEIMLEAVSTADEIWQQAVLTDARAREAITIAIGRAEWATIEKFSRAYVKNTRSDGKTDNVLLAILQQDGLRDYKFTARVLQREDDDLIAHALPDRLLSALLFTGDASVLYPQGSKGRWHERLARHTGFLFEGGVSPGLQSTLVNEIVRRLRSPLDEWLMLAGIEKTRLLDVLESTAGEQPNPLKVALAWLSDPPSDPIEFQIALGTEQEWSLQSATDTVKETSATAVSTKPSAVINGGVWARLKSRDDLYVHLRNQPAIELVVYDSERESVVASAAPGEDVMWPIKGGEDVLVAARPYTSDALSGKVTIRAIEHLPLAPTERNNAIALAQIPTETSFITGDTAGEGWLSLSLQEGQRITVETGALPESRSDLDTVITLLDAATDEQLAWNDDGPRIGLYSRLEHTIGRDAAVLIRIANFGDQPFPPGTEFLAKIDVTEPRPIAATVGATTRDEPYNLEAEPQIFEFAAGPQGGEAWFRISLAGNQRIAVETGARPGSPADLDTVVTLLDAATGELLAGNDDGPELRLYSRLEHTAWRDTEALIRIVQFGDRPFAPGTEFTVDLAVESVSPPETLTEFPARFPFETTEATPEGLYRVALEAGQTITAETGRASEGPEIDTVVILFDAETGELLAWNDDGAGIGLFSRATYRASNRTDLLVRVFEIRGQPFAPGTRFTIDVDVSSSDQRAESSLQSP